MTKRPAQALVIRVSGLIGHSGFVIGYSCPDGSDVKPAFLALAASNVALMVATATTGWLVEGDAWFVQHFALGLMTTLFLCLGHCAVLTYFMATSKMIRLAVEDAGLNILLAARAQYLKRWATSILMPAILMALGAAAAGAWATINPARATVHLVIALGSAVSQLLAFWGEYRLINANSALMNTVFQQHQATKLPGRSADVPKQ
jgi:hypothetical protein